jgi:hypothetical protein
MSDDYQKKPIVVTDAMRKILAAPLPNMHETWQKYLRSDFRRQYLRDWAGDDPEKQREVEKLLAETTPM